MSTNILMPALSPTMTEGTLSRWLKHEGDSVRAGDVIAEIETDKATMEVEAVDEGVLEKILVPDGTAGVKVNEPIGVLAEKPEAASAEKPERKDAEADETPPAPKDETPPAPKQDAAAPPTEESGAGPKAGGDGQDAKATEGGREHRIFASPLARRMANQAGIDLGGLEGTGPGGRIVKADIDALTQKAPRPAAAALPAETPAAPPPSALAPVAATHKLVPHSAMRQVIARRLTEAKRDIPHFYVSMDIELDALLSVREQLNAKWAKEGPGAFKLSVNDMVIKAAAIALRRVPAVNAFWTEQGIARCEDVDISVAVSIPEGLITPIVRRADQKGLAAISAEMKTLAARARAGKLKPEEFQGGGFSISNLGMHGVREFSAIINPPQAAILAVGAGQQRPVVRGGALGIATVMTCTLSVDHRVVDGALGAEWLGAFKGILEDPLSLML